MVWRFIIASLLSIGSLTSTLADEPQSRLSRPFNNPQAVHILGLPAGAFGTSISTEEPFISRDGRFLFFNSGAMENHKDLHYAEAIKGKWVYRGEIGADINTKKEVEGNPTMDSRNNFYYIDSSVNQMVRVGRFDPNTGILHGLKDFEPAPNREVKLIKQRFHGNMGVEVSADGEIIFLSRAVWKMRGLTLGKFSGSNIIYLVMNGNSYFYDQEEVKRVMKYINTHDLEYAASISSSGLELFFTRFSIADYSSGKIQSRIMRASRKSVFDPFGKPVTIKAIGETDFVEGPAISKDSSELYYHKHDGKKFRLYKVVR